MNGGRVVEPARVAWRDGVPYSNAYGDVYASRDGAAGQARHVFLGGNGLPQRWRGRRQFVVLETGFGLGVNFLACWQAWRDDPQRPQSLHFVSFERHPVPAQDLRDAAPPEFSTLAGALAAAWPLPLPGMHRLEFDGARVVLTLGFGDARTLLPSATLGADAIFLDGFAPSRNPQLWEPSLLKAVSRSARPGATVATWSTAAEVRAALAAAGFELEQRPGYGRKREMLAGRYAPRFRMRRHEPPAPYAGERSALVVGAGLAGCAAAAALSRRGWTVTVADRGAGPASGASGLPCGLLHPHPSADDNTASRLSRAGFLLALRRLDALPAAMAVSSADGVLQLDDDPQPRAPRLPWPAEHACRVDAATASAMLGTPVERGGTWFPGGRLVSPPAWCRAMLQESGAATAFGTPIEAIASAADGCCASAADGRRFEAAAIVVASAFDTARLLPLQAARLRRVHGQASLAAAVDGLPPCGVAGDGYLLPARPALGTPTLVGATYETALPGEEEIVALPADAVHASNRTRLQRLLPQLTAPDFGGRFAGDRCASHDRLPLAGPVADVEAAMAAAAALRGAHLADLPRMPGIRIAAALGSRGLVLHQLVGEIVASGLEGEPMPVEAELLGAVDPGRFLLQRLRRG